MISSSKKKKIEMSFDETSETRCRTFSCRAVFFQTLRAVCRKTDSFQKMMSWAFLSFFFASRLGHLVHQEKSEPPIFGHFLLFCRKKKSSKKTFPSNDVISKQQNRPRLKLNNFESSFRFSADYRVEK